MERKIKNTITNIYKINLNVKKHEKVIVFTDNKDKKLKNIAKLIEKEGRRFSKKTVYVEFPSTGNHGVEPPETLWIKAFGQKALNILKARGLFKTLLNKKIDRKQLKKIEYIIKKNKKDAVNVIIAISYYSTSHTKFRDLLTHFCGTRYASMPLFDRKMLEGAMRVNWKKMAERTQRIARKANSCKEIEIKAPNGTFITLSKRGRKAKADTGIITKKGSFSNLPAGEVFFAPVEGTANGRLVIEWAPTRKLKTPVILNIKNGMVKKITGEEEYATYLRAKLSERHENANIAELGIGTNDMAKRPDNLLESEKILGTIHIALGDNSSFGGKVSTPFHQDFVFFKPTVTLIHKDGKRERLLKEGTLLVLT